MRPEYFALTTPRFWTRLSAAFTLVASAVSLRLASPCRIQWERKLCLKDPVTVHFLRLCGLFHFFFFYFFFFFVFDDEERQEESCDDTLERTTPTILYHYTTGLALIVNCELFPFSIDWHCVSCCTVYRLCTLYRTVKTRLSVVQIDSILGGLAQVGLRVVELN